MQPFRNIIAFRITVLSVLFVTMIPALWGCSNEPENQTSEKSLIVVSILPQQFFVKRLAGELVDTEVLVKPGQSPATYDPTPRQISLLSEADVWFAVGVPFENVLVSKIFGLSDSLRVVDMRSGIKLRRMMHQHGDHNHSGGNDPHTWLSPIIVTQQVTAMCDVLCEIDPVHADAYRLNLSAFIAELETVDQEITAILRPYSGRTFYVYHPSYGYFADAYGLKQVSVEREGKEPGAQHLTQLVDELKSRGIKVLFVQPQFSSASAEAITQAIGGEVVALDPLSPDYMNNMVDMANKIAAALNLETADEH